MVNNLPSYHVGNKDSVGKPYPASTMEFNKWLHTVSLLCRGNGFGEHFPMHCWVSTWRLLRKLETMNPWLALIMCAVPHQCEYVHIAQPRLRNGCIILIVILCQGQGNICVYLIKSTAVLLMAEQLYTFNYSRGCVEVSAVYCHKLLMALPLWKAISFSKGNTL